MASHCRSIARKLVLLVLSGIAAAAITADRCALAQSEGSAPAIAAPQAAPAPSEPRVDTGQIARRVNQELGIDLEATTAGWKRELDRLEGDLRRPRLRYSELNGFRDGLQRMRSAVEEFSNRLQPRLDAVKAQLDLLGPPPATGQLPEPEQAALGRAELNYHLGVLSEGQAAANSAKLRVDPMLNAIQDIRRQNFASVLFQPVPGVYAYETWAKLPDYVPSAASQVGTLVGDWWSNVRDAQEVARIGLEALLLCLVLSLAGWRGVRRLRRREEAAEPPFWRRASFAAAVILLRALPIVAPTLFLYGRIAAAQPLPDRVDWLFYLTAQSIVIVFAVGALVTTVFAPRAPQWRLVPASDAGARRICGLVIVLALVYSLTSLLYVITRLVQAPFALTIAVALPSSLLLAGLVVAILRTPWQSEHQDAARSLAWLRAIRMIVGGVVAAIVLCALGGYLALARFLAQQLIVTGSILALVYLLLLWADGFAQGLSDDGAVIGRWLEQRAGLERRRREQLALPISLFLKFAVLVLSVPLIMLQWGYTWPDIHEWYRQLFFGLHIANTQVTFGALLASIMVFGLGYAAARLFQGWLDAQILQPAGISGGVRDSIRTGVGYAGILIAAVAAFSYAGFNLSSLAIVAGAFSIGIGFGLQNLVNNFVSGLILLAERPIRVGDLVVVGGEEGYVRKISVRSTEVETFDRAHVLIPNSYFISEKVKNWTFRNSVRRLAIPVGVAYGCEPRHVQAMLLRIALDHPDVLATPEPVVALEEFAATSLNFTLYAFIDDVTKTVKTRTDLRMAILESFAQAGIVIPFGQTDIAIRNMEWLREAITGHAALPVGRGSGNGSRVSVQVPAAAK